MLPSKSPYLTLQGIGPVLASEILLKMNARPGATTGQYSQTRTSVLLGTDRDNKPGSKNEFAAQAVIGKS